MKLYLARHGETDLNIDDRYQGRSNALLNERGLAQAEALAAALPPDITHIVASPLLRALHTAQAVGRARGLPVRTMAGLREKHFGRFDGLTPDEVAARFPVLWHGGVLTSWDQPPPGGETTRAVVQRVSLCLDELRAVHAGDTVLLVVHGFVVRALRHLIDGLDESEFFIAPRIGNAEFLVRELPDT
ncbi:Phosphoglycerate mutase [Leptothrix cholodnii SP-6]|uniref:Phosphoglycerate mutase n=1 Tax=Leptothrix cholodnii (strain ATCC 51168 / LMG 8142 / SP-6) TaxID=395495 RepID=B1Y538_LEPCP|nr:histidine phosphatase family protein [Leptothrix cholodnii]ACB35934.1 Phosphoglycerate mutase [Leptothrix cholodnii SP-6]